LNKIGYKKGMSIGLMIMAIGALVFISSAEARTYWVFLSNELERLFYKQQQIHTSPF
jgi:fucose permease